MKPALFLSTVSFLFILSACHNQYKTEEVADTLMAKTENNLPPGQEKKGAQKQKIPIGNLNPGQADSSAQTPQPAAHIDWDKKIIKTATIKLEVKDFKKYNETLHKTIGNFGGYIATEEQNNIDQKSESILSIKVPVDQFEPMMNELSSNDVKTLERRITSQDVTGETIDTRSRLEAKRQVRLKYLDFLKQSKNMEEVLQVQGEINSIQEEIEAAAGRVEYLNHQSAYSTINLTFYQPFEGFKRVDESPSFFTRTSNAFKSGSEWIADLFVAMISIWPLLLIIFAFILVFKKRKFFKISA